MRVRYAGVILPAMQPTTPVATRRVMTARQTLAIAGAAQTTFQPGDLGSLFGHPPRLAESLRFRKRSVVANNARVAAEVENARNINAAFVA
jgi:hypothetical protein